MPTRCFNVFFFFNDTATTEIYTLSLHDALPICGLVAEFMFEKPEICRPELGVDVELGYPENDRPAQVVLRDRKSTRLNSSHANISYAVFCLKKKNNKASNSRLLYKTLPF